MTLSARPAAVPRPHRRDLATRQWRPGRPAGHLGYGLGTVWRWMPACVGSGGYSVALC